MLLVIKQSACSSARQDYVSIDRCLWLSNNRPAHRRARIACRLTDASGQHTIAWTARRLTDAPGYQTLGQLLSGPTQPHSPQSPLCLRKLTLDLTNRPEQSHMLHTHSTRLANHGCESDKASARCATQPWRRTPGQVGRAIIRRGLEGSQVSRDGGPDQQQVGLPGEAGQTAKEASAFWVNSGALVVPHNFLSLVKQGVVQIDVDLELRQLVPGAAEKLLTKWTFTFDADHSIAYEDKSKKKRPSQLPHFGFIVMRHRQRDVGGSGDSLTRPEDKLSVAAHLYVPKGAGEPVHFRRDKGTQSEAIKVKPCCSVTVPYQVPYLQDHVEPIMYKSKCLRKMYFHYTYYSHKTARVA